MSCLPVLDCEHVTFGDDSDTPSRLGINEQFFGLGQFPFHYPSQLAFESFWEALIT